MVKSTLEWLSLALASPQVRRLVQWIFFSFLASLAPFWIAVICSVLGGIPFRGWQMRAHGELLLICFGLGATATGDSLTRVRELVRVQPTKKRQRQEGLATYCTYILMFVVVVAAVSYASLLMASATTEYNNRLAMSIWSTALLVFTTIAASVAASVGR